MALLPEPVAPHPSLGFEDLQGARALPSNFDFISDSLDLRSESARKIQSMIAASVPARLVSLRRFANKKLWRAYTQRRDEVASEHLVRKVGMPDERSPNVQLLFHGTKEPSLILGSGLDTNSEGFDFRRANAGEYGVGSYFASAAAYPICIHPRRMNKDGTYTLLLAEVALGSVADLRDTTDNQLRVPPELRAGLLHHSVRGTENGIGARRSTTIDHGEQFVVYNHNQAYPHFLAIVEMLPPLGVVINLESQAHARHHLQNASPTAKAMNHNRGHWERLMVVQSEERGYVSIMSLKETPYQFLRVDGDGKTELKFDAQHRKSNEMFKVEWKEGNLFFVSKKTGNTLNCAEDGKVTCQNKNRLGHERWQFSVPTSVFYQTALPMGVPVVITSGRTKNNLQNASPAAKAANTNRGNWESLMIVESEDADCVSIMSLKETPYQFLRVDGDGKTELKFDAQHRKSNEMFKVEWKEGNLFFVSKKTGNTLNCAEDGKVTCQNKNLLGHEKWTVCTY